MSQERLTLLDGSTFFTTNGLGDTGGPDDGLYFADTRHLSTWRLTLNGAELRLLSFDTPQYYSARVHTTLPSASVGVNPALSVRRDRIVSTGVHEDVIVQNYGDEVCELVLELSLDADFADIFEVKDAKIGPRQVNATVAGDTVTFAYRNGGFTRATTVVFSEPGELRPTRMRWAVRLPAHGEWMTCIDVTCSDNDGEHPLRVGHGGFGQLEPDMPQTMQQWLDAAPVLHTTFDPARHAYRHALMDLAALRFRPLKGSAHSVPAAGAPWFMALFGRDSLITAYQALPFHPRLARTTLQALSMVQAKESDDFRDADPGKIPHELRHGELTFTGRTPHSPYYGTHDATLLFLILLDEYERWTADTTLVRQLEPAARAAVGWMRGPADPDGDGYLEYRTRSPQGLVNQCWKDSWNSIMFADGRIATPPIATCEIQGYAYDARIRTARLARELWHDPDLAEQLEKEAAALRQRFNNDFWHAERGHFVLALDGDKRQVDAATSNIGHLLWSGIVDDEHAEATVALLLDPRMSSGWGVRTMSSADHGYNPIEYHDGTVWPHDTAIIAEGLRRYGRRQEAVELAVKLLEAAAAFGYRLPEVFAGFDREGNKPVEYPTPSSPQAWSAGSVLLVLRTLFGLDVQDGTLRWAERPAAFDGPMRLDNVLVRGHRHTIDL
ncbi:glycogen debranching N-terminal domain-containing protein [Catellatospora sp. NPDC049133]|uniref:amylo-alpha-1,6-glucosidase n=1 Tax=Catellatospora sp. NPDC049133 TaxID=3155499 RepID=UPI0033FA93FE